MLLQDQQDAQILIGLGLTLVQAEVYLTLARIGKATLRSLSLSTKMDRANIYRVIFKLQELNLVEKIISAPSMYQSVPLHEGIPMLLKQKEQEYLRLKLKTEELLERRKNIEELPPEVESQFLLIPSGSPIYRKIKDMVAHVENTHFLSIYWSDFKDIVTDVLERWKSMINKGVTIRVLVYSEKGEPIPKDIVNLKKNPLFQIRFISSPPKSTISICDDKEALLSVTPELSKGLASLWVSNPNLVAILKEYFETIWNKSSE